MVSGSTTSVVVDPCIVLGRFTELLADGTALSAALDALVAGLALRTAIVRSSVGDLLGVGGASMHAVPSTRAVRAANSSLELPVQGRSGQQSATLTVVGARPSQLPALRTAAAVLGLALLPPAGAAPLLDAAEAERDEFADQLHDGPVQAMMVARYAADAALKGSDPELVRDAVQQAVVEMRRMLWQLRPRGDSGLVEALEQLSRKLVEAGGAPLRVVADPGADLFGSAGVLAYRLVQAVAQVEGEAAGVGLRLERDTVVVDVDGGSPLACPERWALRVVAFGGDLSFRAGRFRLALPLFASSGDDARTTP